MMRALMLVPGIPAVAETCDSSFCNYHGLAGRDQANNCKCLCGSGWAGPTCSEQQQTIECDSSYCSNHGSVTGDRTHGCECTCEGGWHGSQCEKEFSCPASHCNNHGDVHVTSTVSQTLDKNGDVQRVYGCACLCNVGWHGLQCEKSACASTDCSNHGTGQVSASFGCECTCDPGWGGSQCQEAQSNPQMSPAEQQNTECDSSDCSNHGSASGDRTHGCACTCESGWRGSRCEEEFSCEASYCNEHGEASMSKTVSPTLSNNGNVQHIYGCVCLCNVGYQGLRCEEAACASTDCGDHGKPGVANSYGCGCNCEPGWRGSQCEEKSRMCVSSDCNNHGIPSGDNTWGCACTCHSGWRGDDCSQVACDSSDCSYHGVATSTLAGCKCTCDNGWQGSRCEEGTEEDSSGGVSFGTFMQFVLVVGAAGFGIFKYRQHSMHSSVPQDPDEPPHSDHSPHSHQPFIE